MHNVAYAPLVYHEVQVTVLLNPLKCATDNEASDRPVTTTGWHPATGGGKLRGASPSSPVGRLASRVRLRHRFARVGCGTLLLAFCAAGLTLVEASPALADTGWYPFAATPCIWSPYATSGPLPQGQLDYWCPGYDWGTVEVPAGTSTLAILTTAEVAGQLSPYNYGYRNCTDYVAWKLASLGVKPAQYGGRGYSALGNGKTWGTNAAAHGVVNNATPAVGSVAVDPDGEFGHVAFVTAWNGTDIKVSQYNYDEDGNYTTQTGTPAKLGFTSFDHFESYETTPVPTAGSWSDVTPTAKAQGDNMFKGVSCPAPGFCVAVGASVSSTGNERALVETYTGSTWTILRRLTAASEFSELDGVFCTSTTSCVAVGYSHPAKTGYATPLIATLSGSTWSVGSGATTQYNDSSLTGVSCTTQTYCVAVGTSVNNTESFTLIEVYKGKGWSLSTSPNPIGAHGQPENNLFGVACAGTTLCVAVGNDQTRCVVPVDDVLHGCRRRESCRRVQRHEVDVGTGSLRCGQRRFAAAVALWGLLYWPQCLCRQRAVLRERGRDR